MWKLWTCLIVACFPGVWTRCNSTFRVPVQRGKLLDAGRLLDIQKNVTYEDTDFWQEGSEFWSCPCNQEACLFKCCPLDEEMAVESCAPATHEPIPSKIKLLPHNPCSHSKFRLPKSHFGITQDGLLDFSKFKGFLEPFTFCVDRETDGDIIALVCEEDIFLRATSGTILTLAVPLLVFPFAILATRWGL